MRACPCVVGRQWTENGERFVAAPSINQRPLFAQNPFANTDIRKIPQKKPKIKMPEVNDVETSQTYPIERTPYRQSSGEGLLTLGRNETEAYLSHRT
jgi:hypothetical protein